MLAPDGTPVVRRYYCPKQERSVDWDDIVHGYEVDSGRYVVLSEAELQALAPKKSREIDLSRFVSRRSIDPILFERAYFLAPAGSSSKAYHLLVEAMEATDQAGIGTFVMRGKEHLAAILAESGVLRLEMLRFADEVRSPASLGLDAPRKPDAQRLRSMIQAIDRLATAKLGRQELEDRYSDRVRALAAKKLERGVDVVELPEAARRELNKDEQGQNIVDLMESLKRSLGVAPKRVGPMRSASDARTTQPTSAKSARRRPATTRRPHAPRAA